MESAYVVDVGGDGMIILVDGVSGRGGDNGGGDVGNDNGGVGKVEWCWLNWI